LLYAGRISPEKGIQTAIQAVEDLVHRRGIHTVKLLIAGGGQQGYVAQLRQTVSQANLEDYITFLGLLPKETMPDLYRKVDVFLFTSTWQEPFGRVLVEALAAGVVVVGTATGGSAEILGENVLAFAPGDAAGLADQILRLLEQPELRRQLVENGKQRAVRYFDNTRMVDEIEAYLSSVLEQHNVHS
jgi:glycosyltransferase involved in cell wall biosynthesis